MILGRSSMIKSIVTTFLTTTAPAPCTFPKEGRDDVSGMTEETQSCSSISENSVDLATAHPRLVQQKLELQKCYHVPPRGVDYSTNPTVFGHILRGDLPSVPYDESMMLYAFRDVHPRAPLHALVIPKRYIPTIKSLRPTSASSSSLSESSTINNSNEYQNDLELVQDMKQMALGILQREHPIAFHKRDYILCFHIPPYNSVDHLHLHVLAPASEMSVRMRYGKYFVGMPWCTGVDQVLSTLQHGETFGKNFQQFRQKPLQQNLR